MGDIDATDLAHAFDRLVAELAVDHAAQVVKLIGDAVTLADAVRAKSVTGTKACGASNDGWCNRPQPLDP